MLGRRWGVIGAVAMLGVLGVVWPTPVRAEAAAPPAVVPSIQRWSAGGERFVLGSESRVVSTGETASAARLFAEDLARVGGPALSVVSGSARAGDIEFRIDAAAPEQAEAYRIEVGARISASARGVEGIAHASQTLLQWIRQTRELPGGIVEDWPDYAERGLMIDTGREFFPVDWVKRRIRELAYLKMNYLQLHLSESLGFRLASDVHPEITSPQHYSKDDIRDLVAYGQAYGVEIIPEIDMPSHMNVILEGHQDLILRPARTTEADAVQDSLLAGGIAGKIDLTNPAAYDLIGDILREFLPLFPGRYWHIGGDEYVSDYDRYPQLGEYAVRTFGPGATSNDVVIDYANRATEIVRAFGKTARAWNDGFNHPGVLTLDPSIVIQYWSAGDGGLPWAGSGKTPEQYVREGHAILNAAFTPTYFVSGGLTAALNTPPEVLYLWDPRVFVNGQRLSDGVRGAMVFLWCDDPTVMTPEQIAPPVLARTQVMSQLLWSGTDAVAYPEFAARVAAVGQP